MEELEILIKSQEEQAAKGNLTEKGIEYLNGLKAALKIIKKHYGPMPMPPNNERIYLGNAQEKRHTGGDPFFIASCCYEDVVRMPNEYKRKARNGKYYFKLYINPYRGGPNEYGNTHSVSLDHYKKDE